MTHTHKFYFFLLSAVVILALILFWQTKKTTDISIKSNTDKLISEQIYDLPIDQTESPRGNPGAQITVIEYLDLNCSNTCIEQYHALNKMVDQNPTKIRLFLKPINIGGLFTHDSTATNLAAYCANQQNRYWLFLDALMSMKKRWRDDTLIAAATVANLNLSSWNACRSNPTTLAAIHTATITAKNLNITLSPTIFINNKKVDPQTKINLTEILKPLIQ